MAVFSRSCSCCRLSSGDGKGGTSSGLGGGIDQVRAENFSRARNSTQIVSPQPWSGNCFYFGLSDFQNNFVHASLAKTLGPGQAATGRWMSGCCYFQAMVVPFRGTCCPAPMFQVVGAHSRGCVSDAAHPIYKQHCLD